MSRHITRNEIERENQEILSTGYCTMQNLLKGKYRTAYNSGVYGWNFDVYQIGTTAIITGYRTFKGTIGANYQLIKKYDDKANVIISDRNISYKEQIEKINNLLHELIERLKNPPLKDIFKATYSLTAFGGIGIIDIENDIDDFCVTAFYSADEKGYINIERKRKNKIFYNASGDAYINKNGQRYYINEFMRTDI